MTRRHVPRWLRPWTRYQRWYWRRRLQRAEARAVELEALFAEDE